jgi:hypothetical protein
MDKQCRTNIQANWKTKFQEKPDPGAHTGETRSARGSDTNIPSSAERLIPPTRLWWS